MCIRTYGGLEGFTTCMKRNVTRVCCALIYIDDFIHTCIHNGNMYFNY